MMLNVIIQWPLLCPIISTMFSTNSIKNPCKWKATPKKCISTSRAPHVWPWGLSVNSLYQPLCSVQPVPKPRKVPSSLPPPASTHSSNRLKLQDFRVCPRKPLQLLSDISRSYSWKVLQCLISVHSGLVPHCDVECVPPESDVLSQMMGQRGPSMFQSGNHSLAKGTVTANLMSLSF